jgi:hypothetical protein
MLIIDGVKYNLWIPKEEKQLEEMVEEHIKDIFGEGSIYFEKRKISSEFGIPSIPDGFVINFISKKSYAIEIELSTHRYDHIVSQGNRHIDAIRDLSTRNKIVRGFKEEIKSDPYKKLLAEKFVKEDLFEFLTSISEDPELVIIADEISNDIKQAERVFVARIKTNIRDFKTFERDSVGLRVHAHLFEPISPSITKGEVSEIVQQTAESVEIEGLEINKWGDLFIRAKNVKKLKQIGLVFEVGDYLFTCEVDKVIFKKIDTEKPPELRENQYIARYHPHHTFFHKKLAKEKLAKFSGIKPETKLKMTIMRGNSGEFRKQ